MLAQYTALFSIISLVLAFVGICLGLFATFKTLSMQKKMTVLFSGKEAKDLEKIILDHSNEIMALDKEIQELFEISNKINNLAFKSIHKVGIVRFNPFKDIGGDQSFAIAILNGSDTGLVISSLHTREGTRVYAKPLSKGLSQKYTLTEEEKQAVAQAISIKPNPSKKSIH